jgi:pimeloyl-ACP methyl ester carboxylesterase
MTDIKSVKFSTGVTIQNAELGDPLGLPVLLMPGLSDSLHSFELVLRYLPESILAFAITPRGHGESRHPEAGYRFKHLAADALAFMAGK